MVSNCQFGFDSYDAQLSLSLLASALVLRQLLTTFSSTSKLVKNIPLRVILSTLLSVFGHVVKHSLSCMINSLKQGREV